MANEAIEFVFRGDASDLAAALKEVTGGLEDAGKAADGVGDKSEKGFNKTITVSRDAKKAIVAVGGAFVAAGAAAVKMARDTLKLADRLNRIAKEAKEAGTTAEEFQKLEGALGLLTKGGVSAAQTARFLNKNLADARDGAGPAADALAKLGLEASDLAALPLTERLATVGDAMQGINDQSTRTQVAVDLLGRSGAALLPAFEAGGDAVRDAAAQIENAGILSNEAAAQAEGLMDAVDLLSRTVQTLKDQTLVPLIPVFTATAQALSEVLQPMVGVGNTGEHVARIFREFVAPAFVTIGVEVRKAFAGLKVTAKAAEVAFNGLLAVSKAQTLQFAAAKEAYDRARKAQAELVRETAIFTGVQDSAEASGQRFLERLVELEMQARRTGTAIGSMASGGGDRGAGGGAAAEDGDFDLDGQMTHLETLASMQAEVMRGYRAEQRAAWAEHMDSQQQAADEAAEHLVRTQDNALSAVATIGTAVSSIVTQVVREETNALINQTERGTKARREAALKAFRMNKAAALVNAGINTALAITNAANTVPFVPLGIIAMAAAAAAGAVQIGIIAAKQPPQFHSGGVLSQNTADEITVRARAGEGFLSTQGVRAAGGAEGVARMNRGGRSGPDAVYVVNSVGSQLVDVQTTRAIRRTDSPLSSALRSTRPRAVGRHDPFAKV